MTKEEKMISNPCCQNCKHPRNEHGYVFSKKTGCVHPFFINQEIEICPCRKFKK